MADARPHAIADPLAGQTGYWYRCSARSLFVPGLIDEDVLTPRGSDSAARIYVEAAHEELVPDQDVLELEVVVDGLRTRYVRRPQPMSGCARSSSGQRHVSWSAQVVEGSVSPPGPAAVP